MNSAWIFLTVAAVLCSGASQLSSVPGHAVPVSAQGPLGLSDTPQALRPAADPTTAWPTYMANVERTSANLLDRSIGVSNVSELRPIWSLSDNGSDFSAPIIANGTLFYGSWNGNETAVNVSSGAVLWSTYLGTDPSCGGYTPMGVSSTPAYLNGTLYLGGGDGYWYALNATSGHADWRYLVGNGSDGFYDWASALAYRSSLYIGIASCFDSPLVPAGLLELNISGPSPTFSHEFNTTPPNSTGESIWTTPALDPRNNTLWIATGNENPPGYPRYANAIVGLNASTLNVSGSWQVPNVAGQDADFGSTPTLFQSGPSAPLVVATNKNGVAYALNRSNVSASGGWAPSWNLSTGGGYSGGAFDGHTLYLAGGSTVYAVDPANGTVVWTAGMVGGGGILGSLAWANGLVFASGGNAVEAIDAANGTVLWNATLPVGQSAVTEPVVSNGRLFVASGDYGTQGFLSAFGLPSSTVYPVTFHETGLPVGKNWQVSVGGSLARTTSASLTFYEPNGTYGYLARGPAGFRVGGIHPTGNLTVAGTSLSEAVQFVRGSTRTLAFHEVGLIPGSLWCVVVERASCSVRATIVLANLTPGSYGYAGSPVTGYSEAMRLAGAPVGVSGTANLSLRGWTFTARFSPNLFAVTFNQTGLPGTILWHAHATCTVPMRSHAGCYGMTAGGAARGGLVVLELRNGTYTWRVAPILGYELEVNSLVGWTGALTVNGSPVTLDLTFVRT